MRPRVLGLTVLVAACGPSFQTIYENDARFEHCYALEEGSASLTEKANCWNDWKKHHTLGQTRDCVDYATSRYVALNSNALPTDEGMMQAAPGEVGERTQNTAPAPTNPFAPPEAMANEDAGSRTQQQTPPIPVASTVATQEPTSDAPVRPPGAACTDDCAHTWDSCKRGRETKRCDGAYDRCVVGCVKH